MLGGRDQLAAPADLSPTSVPSPTVSVVIPAHNAAAYIGASVTSALEQTSPPLEVIVVNDSSTDDTLAIVEAMGEPVRCLSVEVRSAARARNAGIRAARGSHVAFLDADDLWHPEKLERQLALLDSRPELQLIYSGWTLIDEEGHRLRDFRCKREFSGLEARRWLRRRNSIQVSSVLAQREALLEVGLFDPTLEACENWDLWIRLADHGEIDFIDDLLVGYRQHAGCTMKDIDRMRRARLRVIDRHAHGSSRQERHLVLSLAYFDSGLGYRVEGRRWAAARDFWRSLLYRPNRPAVGELWRLPLPTRLREFLGNLQRRQAEQP